MIPLWRQQARDGKPLTVTDPEMTRFWMGERNAVQMIEWAAHPGFSESGAIAVPKMHSLSLAEMAHIIAPGAELKTTGLRSVEKRHEDLIHVDEPVVETLNDFSWIVDNKHAKIGHSYTSYDAPRLTPAAFRAMLAEAEAHE